MAAPAFSIQNQNAARLSDPALREGLLKFARRRLPPSEVEDLVQNTLTEALVAANPPDDAAEFRRWVHGIARHKIADSYRRRGRLPLLSPDFEQRAVDPSPPLGELGEWIESELPKTENAQATLHWLLREGEGETLDEIARDVDLPAPRVRQRVSRLRRHFHARWLALGAAGLLSLLGVGALFSRALQPKGDPSGIAREPITPLERARSLRLEGLQHCAAGAYRECIAALDQAKDLDPAGENAIAINEARAAAANAERSRAAPELPAGSPSGSASGGESTPKPPLQKQLEPKRLPSNKLAPKQFAPSKPTPKSVPLGSNQNQNQKQNALPSKALPAFDDLTGDAAAPATKPRSQKF
ncbi:MAG TPA: sigma-70 family RNA polymerase sigma factor [Polyangiaceae bacterium]|nr:sigma-70 family RNA polymerase sigma factor [Polyangiaceae bacterium]